VLQAPSSAGAGAAAENEFGVYSEAVRKPLVTIILSRLF